MKRSILENTIIAILVLFVLGLNAQITIQGKVIDKHSKEPVPFANVFMQSEPTKGVSADFDGLFKLYISTKSGEIEISALGYESYIYNYKGESNILVELESSSLDLEEVVITAKSDVEDPAYPILRKVLKNKAKNNRSNYDAYACEVYNKMEIDLINITEGFKNMRLNKPFKFVFEHMDSVSGETPFLPLFVSETLSDYYFQNNPKKDKEQIKAIKVVGDYDNENVGHVLGIAKAQLNAYDNWIDLIVKRFAGPISDNAEAFYNYYLVDSAMVDNKFCYQIQYFPRHKGVNGFTGDFWVHDTTFAIKKIKLQLLKEGHLNFVDKLTIVQEFDTVEDSIWIPIKDYLTISSTTVAEAFMPSMFKRFKKSTPGVQIKRNTTFKDYGFDRNLVEQKVLEETEVLQGAFQKDQAFWDQNRHVALAESEKTAYFLIDTIKNLPVINIWKKVSTTAITGYMWDKYVDIGNVHEFFSRNDIEGIRNKFGLRTSTGISQKASLGGYGAYGWKDKKWKYGFDLLYVSNVSPRRSMGLAYLNDFAPTSNFNPYFSLSGDGIGSNSVLRRDIPFKLLEVENFSGYYFEEWKSGFSTKISFTNQRNNPLFNFKYKLNNENPASDYRFTEAALELRYAHDEVFLSGAYERTSLGSKYPITSIKYSKGIKDLFDGDLDYHRLELTITDKVHWGGLGYTKIRITGGKTWGTLPYLNLYVPEGNEGFFYHSKGFNTVPEYTFATDRFAYASFDHHFDGLILQMIPLVRKLRLRSVVNFRAMIGDLSQANLEANAGNLFENTSMDDAVRIRVPNQSPFMEAGVGIENIFRLFRIDAIWRLNYHDLDPNHFGVRASVSFAM